MPSRTRRPGAETDTTDVQTPQAEREPRREGGFMWRIREMLGQEQEPAVEGPASDTPILDAVEEVTQEQGPDVDSEQAAEQVVAEAERRMARAEDLEQVTLTPGAEYTVSEGDMEAADPWKAIARNNGMSPGDLKAFNQHILEVSDGGPARYETAPLAVGARIYLPSAQELGFAEVRKGTGTYEEAVTVWGEMSQGPNVKVLEAARSKASGVVGESFGTQGVDGGKFMTANPTLAGASKKRSEMIDGVRQYKVFWLKDFWKCSLYMHDAVWQAGYKPHQSSNDHYLLAGKLHQSKHFTELTAADARPGDCWQRFGGTRSDESHNAVLSSMVDIEDIDETHQRWSMDILGAESDRAAESERSFVVDKSSGTVTEGPKKGKIVRFFRPKRER